MSYVGYAQRTRTDFLSDRFFVGPCALTFAPIKNRSDVIQQWDLAYVGQGALICSINRMEAAQLARVGSAEQESEWTIEKDQLVSLWQCHPCFFDVMCPEFSNRVLRERTWKIFTEALAMTSKNKPGPTIVLDF